MGRGGRGLWDEALILHPSLQLAVGGGVGGVWEPRVCVQKMALVNFDLCPQEVFFSGGRLGGGRPSSFQFSHSSTALEMGDEKRMC